ncbi:hypothetical protein L2Y94_18845 [Luteibacter aegosomatis]|uniref:hypothetical protein n=1 Tax=Luteibacter aegosomatis TaxID=2911537 RepID=UPI001FF951DF|nr:hypothetical protein [Luteibacter aegosomatis]UPG85337.1 hypothetical protein L2Y94_18845 [Luteibacter aegosomatis]
MDRSRTAYGGVIYRAVSDFTAKGRVQYVAHAVMSNDVAVAIGPQTESASTGESAENHPDREFWAQRKLLSLAELQAKCGSKTASIDHIEIDCTLTPCEKSGYKGCLHQIPPLVKARYGDNVKLTVFSHRDEGMGGKDGKPKRYLTCKSNSSTSELTAAFADHKGWDWTA